MRNWFNWNWDKIFVVSCILATVCVVLLFLVPLGVIHYHDGMPHTDLVLFLLDWFGEVGAYTFFIASVGYVYSLLTMPLFAIYAEYIRGLRERRLSLDSYTIHSFIVALVGGFGLVGYLHATTSGAFFPALFLGYVMVPALAYIVLMVWVAILGILRLITRRRVSY